MRKGIVLVNAVYFNKAWQTSFYREDNERRFSLAPNSTIKVATVHQLDYFEVVSRPGFRAVRLIQCFQLNSLMGIWPCD